MTGDGEAKAVLRVNRSLAVPHSELQWRFVTSGGPGGQHANRAATKVELSFDVESSPTLGPRQRQRLMERLGPVVRVSAADERSQARNREVALERLAARLAEALRPVTPRRPTAPTRSSKVRRVDAKRRRSTVKRLRRPPGDDT